MYFKSSYLRVVTPVTEDGNRPKLYNGQQVYKETALPLSAKKHLEEQNRKLPSHLKKIIEVVSNDDLQPAVTNQADNNQPKPGKLKPGPKPKHLQNA